MACKVLLVRGKYICCKAFSLEPVAGLRTERMFWYEPKSRSWAEAGAHVFHSFLSHVAVAEVLKIRNESRS